MRKKKNKLTDAELELMAEGKIESGKYFGEGKMIRGQSSVERRSKAPGSPEVQRVNVDFSEPMLKELDQMASELNISRQAVIKTMVRDGLDRHYVASQSRKRA
jgi:hypothetical protein